MKILLTGAFGNVGASTITELLKQGHTVRCFDLATKANQKLARSLDRRIELVWGDIRSLADVKGAVEGQEVVIHLAALIPPGFDAHPELGRSVNVGGTHNVIEAIKAEPQPPRLVYSSSIAVYGNTQHLKPPRTVTDPVQPTEPYAKTKAECEEMIKASNLEWVILRFNAVAPLKQSFDKLTMRLMFETSLDSRIEFVHSYDVGLALANAASSKQVSGKILLIGGGTKCQMYLRDYIGIPFDAVGIGRLPEAAYSKTPFHTDWMDTTESQALLNYQRYIHADYLQQMVTNIGFKRHFIKPLRPLIRWWLLQQSPYYNK